MALKLSNNATSLLSASITASQTTISITSGDEGKFPSLSAGDWHPVTVYDEAGNVEVMRVTGRAGLTLTVERAQEGSSAKAFSAGAHVAVRVTAATLTNLDAKINGTVSKDVSGNTDVIVSASEALNFFHHLHGTLTGDIAYILPAEERLYVIHNDTTGAFDLTIRLTDGTGIKIPQTTRLAVLSDGANMVPLSPPITDINTILPGRVITSSLRFDKLASAPATIADAGQFYTKEISGKVEAFYRDSLGAETQLTKAGVIANTFDSGTSMVFVQSTAPTGWTKSVAHNDKALRVVSGAASSGGTVAFTAAFKSQDVKGGISTTSLSISHIQPFSVPIGVRTGGGSSPLSVAGTTGGGGTGTVQSGSVGGGNTHGHDFTGTAINLDVRYVDVIIAVKD